MSLLIQQHGRRKTEFFAKVLEHFQKEFFVLQKKLPFQEKTQKTPIVSFSSLCEVPLTKPILQITIITTSLTRGKKIFYPISLFLFKCISCKRDLKSLTPFDGGPSKSWKDLVSLSLQGAAMAAARSRSSPCPFDTSSPKIRLEGMILLNFMQ